MNRVFDRKKAEKSLKRYTKKGLDKETKLLAALLKDRIAGLEVLDVGCGIGHLSIELVKKGAAGALGLDISEASIEAASDLRRKLGLECSVKFAAMDFVENEGKIKKMDVVVSDKVICCYPDMERFIHATASHAQKFYGITYPVDHAAVRLVGGIANRLVQFTKRRGFKFHVHRNTEMRRQIEAEGFERIFNERKGFWVIDLFKK